MRWIKRSAAAALVGWLCFAAGVSTRAATPTETEKDDPRASAAKRPYAIRVGGGSPNQKQAERIRGYLNQRYQKVIEKGGATARPTGPVRLDQRYNKMRPGDVATKTYPKKDAEEGDKKAAPKVGPEAAVAAKPAPAPEPLPPHRAYPNQLPILPDEASLAKDPDGPVVAPDPGVMKASGRSDPTSTGGVEPAYEKKVVGSPLPPPSPRIARPTGKEAATGRAGEPVYERKVIGAPVAPPSLAIEKAAPAAEGAREQPVVGVPAPAPKVKVGEPIGPGSATEPVYQRKVVGGPTPPSTAVVERAPAEVTVVAEPVDRSELPTLPAAPLSAPMPTTAVKAASESTAPAMAPLAKKGSPVQAPEKATESAPTPAKPVQTPEPATIPIVAAEPISKPIASPAMESKPVPSEANVVVDHGKAAAPPITSTRPITVSSGEDSRRTFRPIAGVPVNARPRPVPHPMMPAASRPASVPATPPATVVAPPIASKRTATPLPPPAAEPKRPGLFGRLAKRFSREEKVPPASRSTYAGGGSAPIAGACPAGAAAAGSPPVGVSTAPSKPAAPRPPIDPAKATAIRRLPPPPAAPVVRQPEQLTKEPVPTPAVATKAPSPAAPSSNEKKSGGSPNTASTVPAKPVEPEGPPAPKAMPAAPAVASTPSASESKSAPAKTIEASIPVASTKTAAPPTPAPSVATKAFPPAADQPARPAAPAPVPAVSTAKPAVPPAPQSSDVERGLQFLAERARSRGFLADIPGAKKSTENAAASGPMKPKPVGETVLSKVPAPAPVSQAKAPEPPKAAAADQAPAHVASPPAPASAPAAPAGPEKPVREETVADVRPSAAPVREPAPPAPAVAQKVDSSESKRLEERIAQLEKKLAYREKAAMKKPAPPASVAQKPAPTGAVPKSIAAAPSSPKSAAAPAPKAVASAPEASTKAPRPRAEAVDRAVRPLAPAPAAEPADDRPTPTMPPLGLPLEYAGGPARVPGPSEPPRSAPNTDPVTGVALEHGVAETAGAIPAAYNPQAAGRAVEVLLHSNIDQDRYRAIQTLANMEGWQQTPRVAAALRNVAMTDYNTYLRLTAVQMLGAMPGEARLVADTLKASAQYDSDATIRQTARDTLGRIAGLPPAVYRR